MKKLTVFLAAVVVAAACTREASEVTTGGSLVEKTFYATVAEDAATKTELGENNTVLWNEGDKLLVFDNVLTGTGLCSEGHVFTLTSGAGTVSGAFTGKIHESSDYYALVINTDEEISIDSKVITASLPTVQRPAAGSFEKGVNAAFGIAETGNILFRNLGVLLKIQVASSGISSIRISSNDGTAMTGSGKYAFDAADPSFTGTAQCSYVDLYPASGSYFKSGSTYYAIVYPGTHSAGLTVEYRRYMSGKYEVGSVTSDKAAVVNRNNVLNLGSPDMKVDNWAQPEGLVLDIQFMPDGSAIDRSAYAHTITSKGGKYFSTEYDRNFKGYVAHFDNELGIGASDSYYYYDYSGDAHMKSVLTSSHTWEAYVAAGDTTGFWSSSNSQKFLGTTQAGGVDLYFNSTANAHSIAFSTYTNDAFQSVSSGITPVSGKFYHIVGVYDAAGKKITVYVNGVAKKSVTTVKDNALPTLSYSQWIGIGADPGSRPYKSESAFNGTIAVARLYDKALTASEVSAAYAALNKIPDPANVLLDIRFKPDGSAYDASSFARTVTAVGTRPSVVYDNEFGGYVAGFVNEAGKSTTSGYYKFDYTSDTQFQSAVLDGHTMEIYLMPSVVAGSTLKPFSNTQGYGFTTMISSKNKITYQAWDGGLATPAFVSATGPELNEGKYYHIIGVCDPDNNQLRIYVNGQKKATVAYTGPLSLPTSAKAKWIGVGADPSTTEGLGECGFNGRIAFARIYDNALTDADAATLYANLNKISDETVQKPESDLLLDFKFNTDGTVTDASSYARTIGNVADTSMTVIYDSAIKNNVARFIHTPGKNPAAGYAYYDYSADTEFQSNLADGFTMEAYFAPGTDLSSLANQMCPISSMQSGGTSIYIPKGTNPYIFFGASTNDGTETKYRNASSKVSAVRNHYVHVVGVYDKDAAQTRIYVDGELKGTVAAAGTYVQPEVDICKRIVVGGDPKNAEGGAIETVFNGTVAIARIYNSVKTEAEIAEMYSKVSKGADANLLLNVKFNKDWKAYDASPRKKQVETIDGFGAQTWYSNEYGDYVAFLSNKMGKNITTGYYKYDYSSDYAMISALKSGTFAVETYVMADISSKSVKYLSAQESGGFSLYINASGNFGFQVVTNKNGATSNVTATSSIAATVKRFYHVVGVVDYTARKVYLYVDGTLAASATMDYKYSMPANTSNWWLGIGCDAGSTGQSALYGDIAFVRFYGTALSAGQVTEAYNDFDKISASTKDRPMKVSVIGDSISTFKGYIGVSETSYTYRAHYPNNQSGTSSTYGLTHPYQTYWWKIAYNKLKKGMFDTNIAYSGSAVCDDGYPDSDPYPCFCQRLEDYGCGNPDIILIHGGTNDWAHNSAGLYAQPGTKIKDATSAIPDATLTSLYNSRASLDITKNFSAGFIKLLYLVQTMYPKAKVVVVIGDYMNEAVANTEVKICKKFGVKYVNLYAVNGFNDLGGKTSAPYVQPNMPKHDFDPATDAQSGAHPSPVAMDFIANKIYTEHGSYLEN
ncbi:MAG: hypothetical protein IJS66_04625 [Bacteroidales bacterium]|nr:hypothetical protein [Bacteroidales bacterium]